MGEIGDHEPAPSVVFQIRFVPRYRVDVLDGLISSGGYICALSPAHGPLTSV
jgi:hypothetical protein